MRGPLYKNIVSALNKLNIIPTEALSDQQAHLLEDGVTNRFLKIHDIWGKSYLIRINGALWPPFTRADELSNLIELRRRHIFTNVIYHDPNGAFQICKYWDKKYASNHIAYLDVIAYQIHRMHESCYFRGEFPLFLTLEKSYRRLSSTRQEKYKYAYQVIIALLKVIVSDSINFASSHNDLLPTSVYCMFGQALFVDFEYSGINHRTYDLAWLAIKMKLTTQQENTLIRAYDPHQQYGVDRSYFLMKPVIGFLLLCWSVENDHDTQLRQYLSAIIAPYPLTISLNEKETEPEVETAMAREYIINY